MSLRLIDEIYTALHNTKEKPPYTESARGRLELQLLEDFTNLSKLDDYNFDTTKAKYKVTTDFKLLFLPIADWKGYYGFNPIVD